jgi:hypothetical protein
MKITCNMHGTINILLMTQIVFVIHLYTVLQERKKLDILLTD